MRIIDKNKDFYDYLQDPEDSRVFDRRDSFLMTKELFCDNMRYTRRYGNHSIHRFVLLQSCNTFWLFLVTLTKFDAGDMFCEIPRDYTLELVHTWTNYNKPRALLKLDMISFNWEISHLFYGKNYSFRNRSYIPEEIYRHIAEIEKAVNTNNFNVEHNMNHYTMYKGGRFTEDEREEKTIPLFKACGIGNLVDPAALFNSIDEYFSLEKQSAERTESIGLTNNDKIEMHGFDLKTSFRGKNK